MADQENHVEMLESQFPPASGAAFAAARKVALASGQSVLESENGLLYRVFPDGTKEFVKKIEPPTSITPGTKIRLW